jgi:hypothetical protein
MDRPQYIERTLLDEVYKNGEYFFDNGINDIELIELRITAIQPTRLESHATDKGIRVTQLIPGQIAVHGTIKVPIVFSAWFDGGEPFDIYIRRAKDRRLELGILDVVFIDHGPDYVNYAGKGYIPFPYEE